MTSSKNSQFQNAKIFLTKVFSVIQNFIQLLSTSKQSISDYSLECECVCFVR